MKYKHPFTISPEAISLIAEISAQIERYKIRLEEKDGLKLRKANRIKTIRGSLAIEGNSLPESIITDMLEGKTVVGPLKEIKEVKNAISTYNAYSKLNPFSEKKLLFAHSTMMDALVDEPGKYRNSGVGVFEGSRAIHIAPPANRVPLLMKNLFDWLNNSKDHLLIKSSVFHYEFEFIHPFSDGNGRIGRLWQSLLLGKLNPVFEYIPIENMVFKNQNEYYNAISTSTQKNDCGGFIDFMLQMILDSLNYKQTNQEENDDGVNVGVNVGVNEHKVLQLIKEKPNVTARDISEKLSVSIRQAERILANLKKKNLIKRQGPDKTGFWEIVLS